MTYSKEDREKIIRTYVKTKYDALRTAKICDCSVPTVRSVVRKKNLPIMQHGGLRQKKSKLENL